MPLMDNNKDSHILDEFFLLKEKEEYLKAFNLLNSAKNRYLDDYRVFFLLGSTLLQASKFRQSLQYLSKSIEMNPKHQMSSLCIVNSLINLGRVQTALVEIRRYFQKGGRKKKEHKLLVLEMLENITNFSSPEKNLLKEIFSNYVKAKSKNH